MSLSLHNTLTRKTEAFTPIDPENVRMYVCGPTVYARPHLGNARSVVVYDVLYRLLTHLYGETHVTYVRNITDVDDKINAAAKERGITIQTLTNEVTGWFHEDVGALNVLPSKPIKKQEITIGLMIEPKATDHIAQMIKIIETLIVNGHAYAAEGHVLFSVKSYDKYGALSGRVQDDLVAGARVEVESYKRDANDFVLWKPADEQDDSSSVFDSPWGKGRPGWHIECSAMSSTYLGDTFDIHGGGADLMFPHHENEIAQSVCSAPHSHFAKVWVHNGFLTVSGEKMSKSLGNFITVHDLLSKGVKGEVIRYALLSTRYNKPLDWNEKLLEDAKKAMDKFYQQLADHPEQSDTISDAFVTTLCEDLNTPVAISMLHGELKREELRAAGKLLGLFTHDPAQWLRGEAKDGAISDAAVEQQIAARAEAKKAKDFAAADRIRKELESQDIVLEDKPGGLTQWRRK